MTATRNSAIEIRSKIPASKRRGRTQSDDTRRFLAEMFANPGEWAVMIFDDQIEGDRFGRTINSVFHHTNGKYHQLHLDGRIKTAKRKLDNGGRLIAAILDPPERELVEYEPGNGRIYGNVLKRLATVHDTINQIERGETDVLTGLAEIKKAVDL